jgi:HD-like signal output (HDOD) protein
VFGVLDEMDSGGLAKTRLLAARQIKGMNQMGSDRGIADLEKLLSNAQLPALPQSAIRLLELSQDPDNGPAEFAVPIESDPGLTGQVLRFVNSSYFGFRQEISSVKLAITLVGIRTIKNFALWSAVFSLMPNPKCGPFDLKSLWQDSLRRGIFARTLGKLLGLAEAEDLFAAALLQDMAVPLLAKERPAEYQQLLDARQGGSCRLSNLERERFGWSHAEAGGALARSWGLPAAFVRMVEGHTQTDQVVGEDPLEPGDSAIVLSSMLPSVCDEAWVDEEPFRALYGRLAGERAMPLQSIFEQVDGEFAEFAPVLKLASPTKSLTDSLTQPATAAL